MGLFRKNRRESDLDPLIGPPKEDDFFETLWETVKIPILAISYCTVSISCVFVNKVILSRSGRYKEFGSVEFLMFIQAILAIVFFLLFRQLKIINFPIKMSYQSLLRIATVNILFVLMTAANAYSVRHLSMPMVALLKNCQVVFVAVLEYFVLHTRPGKLTIASLAVIVFGSICGSMTDLEFNLIGYISIGVAILSSSLYYIVIKVAFKEHQIPEFTLVFYNSIFSVCFNASTCLNPEF
ncbi:hypothetical protein TRFO_03726 [Tritrichomonas foetus]|uniref:Sugar phosphate transporter domain-containing protein n=1 Tax=Tritrichomonas foetus TaxID=1144522 RepID=A0A1J4KLC5_9EUKA|nr:hypothetical protein TRFO_03726 [Tritrichomonas foetus]|eukprot:OHT12103.1 hypothetical protein TRFO_03726 [Tritrichomonas foetus]